MEDSYLDASWEDRFDLGFFDDDFGSDVDDVEIEGDSYGFDFYEPVEFDG